LEDLSTASKLNQNIKSLHKQHEAYLFGVCSVANLVLGNIEQSEKDYKTLAKFGYKNILYLFEGWIQFSKNNHQQTLDILNQIDSSRICPSFRPYISALKGFCHWKQNRIVIALSVLDNALRQIPNGDWNMWKIKMSNELNTPTTKDPSITD